MHILKQLLNYIFTTGILQDNATNSAGGEFIEEETMETHDSTDTDTEEFIIEDEVKRCCR